MERLKKQKLLVLPQQEGLRLDSFLSAFFVSRSQAEQAIKKSLVYRSLKSSVDETNIDLIKSNKNYEIITKSSHKVRAGESYYIISSPALAQQNLPVACRESPIFKAYNISVPILFEDQHLLVINKPAGVPVHLGPGHTQDTLVHALVHKTSLSSGVDPLRPGVVHRLDKDVSGLMIMSKTKKAEALLIESFKSKEIQRVYRALTVGTVKELEFSIFSFIGRHPKDRKKFYSFDKEVVGSKKAITYLRCLKSFRDKIHHIECRLETGRTHQIRVHLKSRGLPILRDPIYFPLRQEKKALKPLNLQAKLFLFKGIALYSAELKFSHPIYDKPLHFKIPWPKDFHFLLKTLNFSLK